MTELLYLTDSYCKEFEAVVIGHDLNQNGVTLEPERLLSRRRRTAAGSRRVMERRGALSRQQGSAR